MDHLLKRIGQLSTLKGFTIHWRTDSEVMSVTGRGINEEKRVMAEACYSAADKKTSCVVGEGKDHETALQDLCVKLTEKTRKDREATIASLTEYSKRLEGID